MKVDEASSAGQYANALLALAEDKNSADAVAQNLTALTQVLSAEPQFQVFLKHPAISSEDKQRLLKETFKDALDPVTGRLLEILIERRKTQLLPRIDEDYRHLLNDKKGIAVGTLISAEPMEQSHVEAIRQKLAARLGKQLELSVQVDKSLIGGYVLRIGDDVVDGSFKGRLQAIEKSLLSV